MVRYFARAHAPAKNHNMQSKGVAVIKQFVDAIPRRALRILVGSAAICISTAAFSQVGHDVDTSEAAAELAARTVFKNPAPAERLVKTLPRGALDSLDTAPPARGVPKVQDGSPGEDDGKGSGGLQRPTIDPGVSPRNYGQSPFGSGTNLNSVYHYSDSLVDTEAVDNYPFRATGHFAFINAAGGSFRCTASLIGKSILVTAGHCVHQGGNKPGRPAAQGFNKNGAFYPARTGDTFPYGYATANYMVTTSKWFSTGAITEGYDVALVVLNKPVGTTTEFGTQVGWYGFCQANCLRPYWSLTQLGYPANYYSGMYMTEGQHIEVNRSNTDFYHGSGMQGGSSGGPHIANLGSLSDSTANKGLYAGRNIVFSVTSWGYVSDTYKIQGSSSLSGPGNSNNFTGMWNLACKRARALHGTGSCNLL